MYTYYGARVKEADKFMLGNAKDLQSVLNAVYQGAVKECEGREHEGKLVGNGHHMAQAIVEKVKKELLDRGLFKTSET